ncbi:hypothetical protein C8R44DRAFT_196980 [Mycena epipterygia]|nr:hypothetical protein C8R44DRAFT_196980 [Mycena epipterygia]
MPQDEPACATPLVRRIPSLPPTTTSPVNDTAANTHPCHLNPNKTCTNHDSGSTGSPTRTSFSVSSSSTVLTVTGGLNTSALSLSTGNSISSSLSSPPSSCLTDSSSSSSCSTDPSSSSTQPTLTSAPSSSPTPPFTPPSRSGPSPPSSPFSMPPSATPSPPRATSSSSSPLIAATTSSPRTKAPVIGGVLGGIVLLLLAAGAVALYKRRQRARDRREWERTHAEIADAVRQVSSSATPPSTWSRLDFAAARGESDLGVAFPREKGAGVGGDSDSVF